MEKQFRIFERTIFGGDIEQLFFINDYFLNHKRKIKSNILLHIHLEEIDYYIYFGNSGFNNKLTCSFQFNAGEEFIKFLLDNGINSYRFDVEDVIVESNYKRLKLTDGRTLHCQTYDNGKTTGLEISEVIFGSNELKFLYDLPMAKLKLERQKETIKLISREEQNKIPESFSKFIRNERKIQKRTPAIIVTVFILVIVLFYLFLFS